MCTHFDNKAQKKKIEGHTDSDFNPVTELKQKRTIGS